MSQEFQQHINNKTNKQKIRYLDISNNDLTGEANLKDFTSLTSLNAYNNKLESIEFLNSLPNKEKLTSLNFFGNQISEAKNLQNLTSEQFNKLVEKMKDKSIQINSYKSTILMDLLEYTQHLIKSGDNSQRQQAHELQAIIQNSSVKNETQPNKLSYTPLILSGVLVVSLALIIGYLAFDLVNGTLDILMVICLTAIPIITIAGLILNYGFI
ncbi:16617_t:CDS:2 [Funneliformis geosporum]|nr:16617_t:CDS:2 [Funneliformis geosporum]